ncbi:MAG: uracil phosphoribosyltransferase [Flavobacteriales bacterium]|jgi:uracil phosphoribosyltransferase|nr:uracil phosphoribosyltransferase [Bacteroidota bacterium]MDP4587104.1 uracil phosphoribosyltransferase [Flavobacteriales bacterium]MDP4952712.1 uracil phosphoribosyltransferase [Flavobacteriales bacterium]
MIHELGKTNSILQVYLSEIRDSQIQQDRMRFRRNMQRIGEVLAYELSKTLEFKETEVSTPLGDATGHELKEQPVLAAILRAGLPLHEGVLNVFDHADNAFVSAYRKYQNNGEFEIAIEYMSSPDITGKTLILCDPMIATGASMELAFRALLKRGIPEKVYVVSAIVSNQGLNYLRKHMPENTSYWCGAVDLELTAKAYIVPGLGDAGDLAYGAKN